MYLYCINFHKHGSLLFLISNDLLQRDLGITVNQLYQTLLNYYGNLGISTF